MKNLYSHQKDAIKFLRGETTAPLFMEMRLGKTLTSIRYIKSRFAFPCLIIAPYSIMKEWVNQLIEDNEPHLVCLQGTRKQRLNQLTKDTRWYISNYESMERLELYKAKNWKSIICDESVRIANPKAMVVKHILKTYKHVPIRLPLSGNPAPENELQLVNQFIFSQGHFMGFKSYWSFRSRNYTNIGYDWIPIGNIKERIRQYVKEHAFVLSRKDAGLASEKLYQKRYIKMNAEQKKQIKSIMYNFEYKTKEVKNMLSQLICCQYIASGLSCEDTHEVINDAKLKELVYLLKGELKGQKVLIWCKHRSEQTEIWKFLIKNKIANIIIHGDISINRRMELKDFFSTSPYTNVAVLTISSSCKGLSWKAADTSIYYSNEHSNDKRSQSEDRIEDMSKNVPLLIIDLLSEDSVDVDIHHALKNKNFDSELVMNDYRKRFGIK